MECELCVGTAVAFGAVTGLAKIDLIDFFIHIGYIVTYAYPVFN